MGKYLYTNIRKFSSGNTRRYKNYVNESPNPIGAGNGNPTQTATFLRKGSMLLFAHL